MLSKTVINEFSQLGVFEFRATTVITKIYSHDYLALCFTGIERKN